MAVRVQEKRRARKEELVLLLDIGSASVGGALVQLHRDAAPALLFAAREVFPLQERFLFKRFSKHMLEAAQGLLERIRKETSTANHRAPSVARVAVVFSSPWYLSRTKVLHVRDDEPFLVDEKLINSLIARQQLAVTDFTKAERRYVPADAAVTERHITQIKINGYETFDPFGKRGSALEVTLFMSFVAKAMLESVTALLGESFIHTPIFFHTAPSVLFSTVRDLFPTEQNFLTVHVTGEVTDITLVRNEALVETVSFHFGASSFLRKAGEALKSSPGEAESRLSVAHSEAGNENEAEELLKIFTTRSRDWLDYFEQALAHLMQGGLLPRRVFLLGEERLESWFARFITHEQYGQTTLPRGQFDVRVLGPDVLRRRVSVTGKDGLDRSLALEALFLTQSSDTEGHR